MTKKQWLKSLAEKIAADIDEELGEAHSFIKIPSCTIFKTETAGYFVDVAQLRLNRKHCALQLWLDEWAHGLRLYYGFSTTDRSLIDVVADSTAAWRTPAAKLSGKDVEQNGEHWHLIEPLPQQKLNRPIVEIYPNWSFYGCYSSALMTPLIMNGRLPRKLMHEVVSFLDKIVKTLAGIRSEHYGTLTAIERKRIVQHEQEEQWARDRGLAHKCKVRDGYSCQICGFCPSKMYKRINASGAVEAHHKTPFSALSLHRKHVNAEHRLSNALSCGHSKRYAHVLHLLYVPAGLADWCGGSQGSERRNMPVGLGIQISPANSELLKEYTREMGVTLNEALNHALDYFFATVGLAERESRAEKTIEDTIARRKMS